MTKNVALDALEKQSTDVRTNPVKYRQAFVQEGNWYYCDSCAKTNLATHQTTVDIFEGECQGILCHSCKILVRRYDRDPLDLHQKAEKIKEEAITMREKAQLVLSEKVPEMIDHSKRLNIVASYLAWLQDPDKGRSQYNNVKATRPPDQPEVI